MVRPWTVSSLTGCWQTLLYISLCHYWLTHCYIYCSYQCLQPSSTIVASPHHFSSLHASLSKVVTRHIFLLINKTLQYSTVTFVFTKCTAIIIIVRYGSQHTGWLVCPPVIPVCWWSGWGCSEQKISKHVCTLFCQPLTFFSHWHLKLMTQPLSDRLFECCGWLINHSYWRPSRHVFSLAAHLCSDAALQLHFNQRNICWSRRSTRPLYHSRLCFFNFCF